MVLYPNNLTNSNGNDGIAINSSSSLGLEKIISPFMHYIRLAKGGCDRRRRNSSEQQRLKQHIDKIVPELHQQDPKMRTMERFEEMSKTYLACHTVLIYISLDIEPCCSMTWPASTSHRLCSPWSSQSLKDTQYWHHDSVLEVSADVV